jgi:Tfp pilus assembly protein PilN
MTTEGQVVVEEKTSFLKRPVGGGGKQKAASAPKSGKFGIPPRPQVNLMPPEIVEGRHLAIVKRRLFWSIIAILLICVLAFAAAFVLRAAADQRYNDALAQSDTLVAQKKQYSPVIQVQQDIANTTNARTFALSTEVNWTNYANSIQAALPEGVTIQSLTVVGIDPGDPLAEGADPLTRPGVAVISFSALSATLPDASEWIEALSAIPGLADINLQSSVLQDQTGEVSYLVSATAQVTEEALANRTFPDPTAAPSAAPSTEPSASPTPDPTTEGEG